MSKRFRPNNVGESKLISKIESSKEYERRRAINLAGEYLDTLSNAIAMKLVESELVETSNKNTLQEQIAYCLEKLIHADDFDIDYQVAPFRNVVSNPHVVSLFVTAFVIEQLIKHRDVVDIYGSDEEIYNCIHQQVAKHLS
ncbi:MAG TPA: hypothetical protein VKO20_07245 [Desulfosalsimonadaceae bacterium]|nr:hypothetical protein [Desulfosalsimonadaceae bacterium]